MYGASITFFLKNFFLFIFSTIIELLFIFSTRDFLDVLEKVFSISLSSISIIKGLYSTVILLDFILLLLNPINKNNNKNGGLL